MGADEVEVAGDVGARESEVAGRRDEIGGAARRLQVDAEGGVRRVDGTAVVGRQPNLRVAAEEDFEDLREGEMVA